MPINKEEAKLKKTKRKPNKMEAKTKDGGGNYHRNGIQL